MVVLTSGLAPGGVVRHQQDNTTTHVQDKSLGSGTLFIAESNVSWVGADGRGFALQYPSISLHAVSRDAATFPQPCLYLMVDGSPLEVAGLEESESDLDPDESPITEIRFVPSAPDALDLMFNCMSDCSALHPDEEQDSLSDCEEGDAEEGYFEEAGGTVYTREEDVEVLTAQGRATLQHLENLLISGQNAADRTPNGGAGEPMEEQFDDADS